MSVRGLLKRAPPLPPVALASAALENLPDAVVACDANETLVMLNRRARETLGLPAEPIPVEEWSRLFDLYYRDGSGMVPTEESPFVRALRGDEVRDVELEIRPEKGDRQVMNMSGAAVRNPRGEITGAVVVMQDVTKRVAMEERLRLQSSVVANVAEGIALVRAADGDIVYTNEKFERMFGYEAGELVGRHISVVNAPTEQTPEERAREVVGALERAGAWSGETCSLRKDGTRFWTAASISTFEHSEHGTVWVTLQTDITERKAAEDALREAEERFRGVFEESPVGIALVGTDMRFADVNSVFCTLTGYRRDELIGQRNADITHPDDVALDAGLAAQVFSGEIPRYRIDKRYVTKGGEVVPITLTATVVRGPDGASLFGILIVEALGS